MNRPEKIILSKHGFAVLLLFGTLVLCFLIPLDIYLNLTADSIPDSGGLGVLFLLLFIPYLVFLLVRLLRQSGSILGLPVMLEISDCVRTKCVFGTNEQQYPLEDIAEVNVRKKDFELTLNNGREFSFSRGAYSVAQLKSFFAAIGMHCRHESECSLAMNRSPAP